MIRIFRSIKEWIDFRNQELSQIKMGFVPTMGALHFGHQTLISQSVRENSKTLVSIFVNPTQFNDPKDLEKYPRTFDSDLKILERCSADYLLYPEFGEIYPDDYRYKIKESELSHELCGAHRPGHFDGMLTVVMKLLQISQCSRAYFGEKDFQQLELVRGMVKAFFLKTEIIGVPTVREKDGLAMSSRNALLGDLERERAPLLNRILKDPELTLIEVKERLVREGFVVDYIEEKLGRRLAAVKLGDVRLIDNVKT